MKCSTYRHSLAVDLWGDVVLDAGTASGVYIFDLDLEKVAEARRRVPHGRLRAILKALELNEYGKEHSGDFAF